MSRVDWPSRQESRAALALFRRRGWVLAFLGVVVLSVVFVLLGRWQYHRHEGKVERRDRVAANYDAAPAPLADVLAPGTPVDAGLEWRPVRVEGTYLPQATVVVRNRPRDGSNGYEVLVPLRTDAGPLLWVDRGWVPAGEDARGPGAVPAPPAGQVTVVARVRPGEPPAGRTPPVGQALRIDLEGLDRDLARAGVEGERYAAYAVLAEETPAPASAPRLLERPDTGLGINLAYAVQWYGFAVTVYVLLGVAAVREARRLRAEEAPAPRPSTGAR